MSTTETLESQEASDKKDIPHTTLCCHRIEALEAQLIQAEKSYQRLYVVFESARNAETKCHTMQTELEKALKEIAHLNGIIAVLRGRNVWGLGEATIDQSM